MCRAHATVRGVLGHIMGDPSDEITDVVVDMEAGLEHLSRGTSRHVDQMLAVVEPYYRALETGDRVVELSRELGIEDVSVVANKVRDEGDREAIREFCEGRDLEVIAEIPYDRTLVEAERDGTAPIDYDPAAPSVSAIGELTGRLVDWDADGTS